MGRTAVPTEGRAGELIDALRVHNSILNAAQARAAELMVEFADVRKSRDQQRISGLKREGVDPVFRAGEFAALEISAAVKASKPAVHRIVAMARRLQAECPDAYDAWKAGDICQERAMRINRALRRLVFESSKQVLNASVVDVATGQTPELLGRWLNQFVARMEPDQQDERLHRAMEDRYVSIRPDLDGMSFLSALMSSVDAAAVDRILTALAAAAEPGDLRTMAQRRSDALVDMLCGRISNGCHVVWDSNTDADDHLDDHPTDNRAQSQPAEKASDSDRDESHTDDSPLHDHPGAEAGTTGKGDFSDCADCGQAVRESRQSPPHSNHETTQHPDLEPDEETGRNRATNADVNDAGWDQSVREDNDRQGSHREDSNQQYSHREDSDWENSDRQGSDRENTDWEVTDWEQPASVFRPDPRGICDDSKAANAPPGGDDGMPAPTPVPSDVTGRTANGSWQVTPCAGEHRTNPAPVTIGVVVSIQSLFGFSNTPGQLLDRSALVAADQIRELAQQKGTLFYRLLTDEKGQLLDVTEMGRFPSRKLAMATKFRDAVCTGPTCHKSAAACDIDHLTPHPQGPTTGKNLNNDCRPEHRAKTFAGHVTARPAPHRTSWTTPTGHTYIKDDPTLPVEEWQVADRRRGGDRHDSGG